MEYRKVVNIAGYRFVDLDDRDDLRDGGASHFKDVIEAKDGRSKKTEISDDRISYFGKLLRRTIIV